MDASSPTDHRIELIERPSGLLTKSQREFILNEYPELQRKRAQSELDKTELRNRRQRLYNIRKRVQHSISDLSILDRLHTDDLKDAFQPLGETQTPEFGSGLSAIQKLLVWFYGTEWVLETVEWAIETHLNLFSVEQPYRSVNVSIGVSEYTNDELRERYEAGEELSFGERHRLDMTGYSEPMDELMEDEFGSNWKDMGAVNEPPAEQGEIDK